MRSTYVAQLLRKLLSSVVVTTVLLAMNLVAACGGSNSGAITKNLILASDFPVSGPDASEGWPQQNGVQLAVEQNSNLGNGYTLTFLPKDDVSTILGKHDPVQGTANITALIGNKQVMAVVGPFNSNVGAAEIPIANQYGITLISPGNTNSGLTIQQEASPNGLNWDKMHPAGKPNFYFRLPSNDIIQGKVLAKIATTPTSAGGSSAKTAFVIDDNEVYGKGVAMQFTKNFVALGGTIVGNQASVDITKVATFPTLAAEIVQLHPDVIMFGGVTSNGGPQLKAALASVPGGANIPFYVGNGVADDPTWVQQGGSASGNTIGILAAPYLFGLSTPVATKFINDYQTRFGSAPENSFSAMAYDAAMVEITAMKTLIAAGKPVTRTAIRDEVQSISYPGVTGLISFDQNGDNSGTKINAIFYVDPSTDQWVFKQNIDARTI